MARKDDRWPRLGPGTALALLLVGGCLQRINGVDGNGGGPPDAADDGGLDAGNVSDAGDSGVPDAGDAGPSCALDAGSPFGWTAMPVQSPPAAFNAIAGSDAGYLFAAGRDGTLYGYGPWTVPANKWTVVYTPSLGGAELLGIYVSPEGAVVAVGDGGTRVQCAGGCTLATAFSVAPSPDQGVLLTGACGRSASDLYAVGYRVAAPLPGVVYQFDGGAWSPYATTDSTSPNFSCWAPPGGGLFIGARSKILYIPDTSQIATGLAAPGAIVQEPIAFPPGVDAGGVAFLGVSGSGSTAYAVGSGGAMLAKVAGGWQFFSGPDAGSPILWTNSALSPVEALGGGDLSSAARLVPGACVPVNPEDAGMAIAIRGACSLSPNETYLAGSSGGSAVVLKGTR